MRVTTGSLDLCLRGGAAPFLPEPLGKSVVNKLVRFGYFFLHNEMNCKSLPLISATATVCTYTKRFPVDTIGITTEGSALIWGNHMRYFPTIT